MTHQQATTSITTTHTTPRRSALALCAAAITVLGAVMVPTLAVADGGCIPGDIAGQVPRNTRPGDNVCAPQAVADLVQQENAASAQGQGHDPRGAYGPVGCVSGLVWREGFDGDSVCVTPARRTETWQENANAGVGNTGGLKPQAGVNPAGVPAPQGSGGPDAALLAAVNDARVNPGKYPPHGNTAGASMTACPGPFAESGALENTAATHNSYIATLGKDVVNVYPNMHKTGNGSQLAFDQGGPITQAGYNGTGEIVADGFPTEAAAVQFWMQDDGPSNWAHRNLILNCSLTDAGGAHFAGGPLGHYWTVDMGAH
jgi:hypothetical protein